jgi:predicted nucleotidyltransferase
MRPSQVLQQQLANVHAMIALHKVANPRLFGSVSRGTDSAHSDLDLLVDPLPETTLFDIAKLKLGLTRLLNIPIDVLTPQALPDRFRAQVMREAVWL